MGMNCRNCGCIIRFDGNITSKSGKLIPLEYDGKPHKCPNNPFNKKKEFKYGMDFNKENGFEKFGNFILPTIDFCIHCKLYKGLLTTSNGDILCLN